MMSSPFSRGEKEPAGNCTIKGKLFESFRENMGERFREEHAVKPVFHAVHTTSIRPAEHAADSDDKQSAAHVRKGVWYVKGAMGRVHAYHPSGAVQGAPPPQVSRRLAAVPRAKIHQIWYSNPLVDLERGGRCWEFLALPESPANPPGATGFEFLAKWTGCAFSIRSIFRR